MPNATQAINPTMRLLLPEVLKHLSYVLADKIKHYSASSVTVQYASQK